MLSSILTILLKNTISDKPPDQRYYLPNQALPILLPTGAYVGLKVHQKWPLKFANEYEAAIYDNDVANRLLLLKDSIVKDEITPVSDPDLFDPDFDLTELDVKKNIEMKTINNKYKRVERLRNESSLVDLEIKIKTALGVQNADLKKATELLRTMFNTKIDAVMLKKHCHLVEFVAMLKKYVGNVSDSDISINDLEVFNAELKKMQAMVDKVIKKFKVS